MMALSMVESSVPTAHEIIFGASVANRAVVRVIWGRALGSTYQRYNPMGNLPRFEVEVQPVVAHSMFSRPLTCPSCAGSLELCQPIAGLPDQLVGACQGCGTSIRLEVGAEGRITMPGELRTFGRTED